MTGTQLLSQRQTRRLLDPEFMGVHRLGIGEELKN